MTTTGPAAGDAVADEGDFMWQLPLRAKRLAGIELPLTATADELVQLCLRQRHQAQQTVGNWMNLGHGAPFVH